MKVRNGWLLGSAAMLVVGLSAGMTMAQVTINGREVASQGEEAILKKMDEYPWWQTIVSATTAALLAIAIYEGARTLSRRRQQSQSPPGPPQNSVSGGHARVPSPRKAPKRRPAHRK